MADVIQLLPDSVANQIAAGEVIQRPASVVKELIENAIDAGSTEIKVNIKNAGKTLIQIIDNGCGMSETDARMAFERHATSKIRQANDLFSIHTMGFRGEALASIAAIADIDLKTRKPENELGIHINIKGSEIIKQESVNCPRGSSFAIKNLFFNVPARRKFLKTNTTEFRHIINEFQRVALANPHINFSLFHNQTPVYQLPITNLKQRIVNVFGSRIKQALIPLETETSLAKITGFVAKPKFARKRSYDQFFFINGRYMRSPYFHKAVMDSFEQILPEDTQPSYFIYFTAEPESIDVNIHPTKTEIKFENDSAIYRILQASIKQTLGKYNIVPAIDFDTSGMIDIPVNKKNEDARMPTLKVNPEYNPFSENKNTKSNAWKNDFDNAKKYQDWEKLFADFEQKEDREINPTATEHDKQQETHMQNPSRAFLQVKKRYIFTPIKSGLMIIDQKRAHQRILFEYFMQSLNHNISIGQQSLFPTEMELEHNEFSLLMEIKEDIRKLGFDFEHTTGTIIKIIALPAYLSDTNPENIISKLLQDFSASYDKENIKTQAKENLAKSLAKISAVDYGKILRIDEMSELIDNLFACDYPNYSPTGKIVIHILQQNELEKWFK